MFENVPGHSSYQAYEKNDEILASNYDSFVVESSTTYIGQDGQLYENCHRGDPTPVNTVPTISKQPCSLSGMPLLQGLSGTNPLPFFTSEPRLTPTEYNQ